MKRPGLPPDEAARLAELRAYEIIDTEADAAIDTLTALVVEMLDVPIALVSLVDERRQWFKSRQGLDATETSREISFCGHVVEDGAPLVVSDVLADDRFADNPLVTGDPRLRFYAGVPLRAPSGAVLGTLCALDRVPRELTAKQRRVLDLLAASVMSRLEAHRADRAMAAERTRALETATRLDALFESMTEGVIVQDGSGVVIGANGSAERILGLSRDQLTGRRAMDPRLTRIRENGEPFPAELHPATVTLRTGQATRNVIMGVGKKDGDGDVRWLSVNATPLAHDLAEGPAVILTFNDISEIKAAQTATEHLMQRQNLVTIGTLASGVGHEINNPLTFVIANLDVALGELRALNESAASDQVGEVVPLLVEAYEGAERIRNIVLGLQAFARKETEPFAVDVRKCLQTSLSIALHELRSKATVVDALGAPPRVLGDESRISQILVNLIVNAAQAFSSSDVERNRIVVTSSLEPDGRVCIAVSDNGPGIPLHLQRRIFDPFFTTKAVGLGTGLGLSICQNLATALGGEIVVDSRGAGATFRVYLAVAQTPEPAQETPAPGPVSVGNARVLVVDDEPSMITTLRRILGREHRFVGVTDPREALALITAGETYDIVFCDLMMPHLSGDAFYEIVRQQAPRLAERFVFISGGATDPRVQHFLASVPNERIDKPFDIREIQKIARRYAARSRISN